MQHHSIFHFSLLTHVFTTFHSIDEYTFTLTHTYSHAHISHHFTHISSNHVISFITGLLIKSQHNITIHAISRSHIKLHAITLNYTYASFTTHFPYVMQISNRHFHNNVITNNTHNIIFISYYPFASFKFLHVFSHVKSIITPENCIFLYQTHILSLYLIYASQVP